MKKQSTDRNMTDIRRPKRAIMLKKRNDTSFNSERVCCQIIDLPSSLLMHFHFNSKSLKKFILVWEVTVSDHIYIFIFVSFPAQYQEVGNG